MESELRKPEYVDIRVPRKCDDCGEQMPVGTTMRLYTFEAKKGDGKRFFSKKYICLECQKYYLRKPPVA